MRQGLSNRKMGNQSIHQTSDVSGVALNGRFVVGEFLQRGRNENFDGHS